ncbi:MAG: Spore protein SP21 [Syntrophorhabdus sp. PtaU1.Bin153]|nr:MAG: Spore protein SP21 [Syntrophorhabdus sp. PtaU1.Bin153]
MAKKESKELAKTESMRILPALWDVDKWFDEFVRRPFSLMGLPQVRFPGEGELMPSVDIFEEKGDVVVKAELPGINKEDIDVTLTEDAITIAGEKKKEEEVAKKDYYRYECSYGSFNRTFTLPAEVQTDKVKTKFKDGVLEIRMPKTEEAKKKEKKIKIE